MEKLAGLFITNDINGMIAAIKTIASQDDLMNVSKILISTKQDSEIITTVIRRAVVIGASRVLSYVLKNHEDFTLQDILDCITRINQCHIVRELCDLGAIQHQITSINDLMLASPTYKKYRFERFSLFRFMGMSPNVAHHVNELMF